MIVTSVIGFHNDLYHSYAAAIKDWRTDLQDRQLLSANINLSR